MPAVQEGLSAVFSLASWNVGGAALELLGPSLQTIDLAPVRIGLVGLQEVKRGSPGWHTETHGKWCILSYQPEGDWRGTGIAFQNTDWKVLRRKASTKGTWFRVKHLPLQYECWIGSLYVSPHYNTAEVQGFLTQHFEKLPATTLPAFLCSDVNACIKWNQEDHRTTAFGDDSKARTVIDTTLSQHFHIIAPREAQLHQQTSRPRQEGVQGRAIDWIASKRGTSSRVSIETNSCYQMGTDHDLLRIEVVDRVKPRTLPRARTGRRVISSPPVIPPKIDQPTLTALAAQHTKHPGGSGYRDDEVVRELFRIAKRSKHSHAWKRALKARREAHNAWRKAKLEAAFQGDWRAWKECQPKTSVGWEATLADNLAPNDPHQALHDHYASIFGKGGDIHPRSNAPPRSPDITSEELHAALHAGKLGKSVGKDGVSLELLRAIGDDPQGQKALLDWFNTMLHTGDLPPEWLNTIMVLLPKITSPVLPKDTRPIAIACSAEKLFSRIILGRCQHALSLSRPWQCAGRNRQTADFLYTLSQLFEVEREWQKGLSVLKVDFTRAFDSIDRNRLLGKLFAKLGDCEEYRVWENLMIGTTCTLQSPWHQSTFDAHCGIRQGAVESPAFFGALVEWALEDVGQANHWKGFPSTYPDLQLDQVAFMDDLVIWGGTTVEVQDRLNGIIQGVAGWGLHVNIAKCSLYVSPRHEGTNFIKVGDAILTPQNKFTVMGIPFRVGANSQELLQPVWQRARAKFWALRHHFKSSAPIQSRIKMLDRVVGGSAMWCICAFSPEPAALQALNLLLFQMVLWMLGLRKRANEQWVDFRRRGMRMARQLVCRSLPDRWSTQWLSRWWGFQGHVARGLDRDAPLSSSLLCHFRTLEWWTLQQSLTTGMRHSGRFHAKLHQMDRRMNAAAAQPWRVLARDREGWGARAHTWIQSQDLPWASGQQFALEW